MSLVAERISFAYEPGREVLREVSLSVGERRIVSILGANGSGKTTLLDCLSGIRIPHSGRVSIDGRRLSDLAPRERAQRIGVVPQLHEPVFAFSVGQAVLLGRAPHLGLFSRPTKKDLDAVSRALSAVGIERLRDRPYTRISGGERQLVMIARGLAQGARYLLMDEPAAHLDPHHQHGVLSVVRDLADFGFSFVVTSHHPNNALLYADEVVFLVDGRAMFHGPPDSAITEENLKEAYRMEFEIVDGESGTRAIVPRVRPRNPDQASSSS